MKQPSPVHPCGSLSLRLSELALVLDWDYWMTMFQKGCPKIFPLETCRGHVLGCACCHLALYGQDLVGLIWTLAIDLELNKALGSSSPAGMGVGMAGISC